MTPAEKEAEKVSIAYQDALILLGDAMVKEVLTAFESVSINRLATFSTFSARVTAIIYTYRKKARDLAVAETQLTRALLTGATYSDWQEPLGGQPTIGALRNNFYQRVEEFGVKRPPRARDVPATKVITVDLIPEIEAAEKAEAKLIDKEIEETLRILGEEAVEGKIRDLLKPDTPLERARRVEQEIRDATSSNLALGSERVALNGGRHYDAKVLKFDRKVEGWVRSHLDGQPDMPCGWCSMLMSRGAVYASEKSAIGGYDDADKFHPGCHCVAVKVYTRAQYNSPRFDLNRKYDALWQSNISGKYHGDEAVSQWRKLIRRLNESERPTKFQTLSQPSALAARKAA